MNHKAKKQNCPRLANAIKRACEYAHGHSGWWYAFRSDDLGRLIYDFAYKADRYDVLNKLCPGAQTRIVTFARGDIRHRRHISKLACLIILAVALVLVLVTAQVIEPD